MLVVKTSSDKEESLLVANTILHLKEKTTINQDFTILYRTNAQSRALEESLRFKNIPYKIYGAIFYQRKEVKDL